MIHQRPWERQQSPQSHLQMHSVLPASAECIFPPHKQTTINPCPGPLHAGVPLVSSSPVLSPWVGPWKYSTLHPRLNYLLRWFKRFFHLVPGVLSLFCFLLMQRRKALWLNVGLLLGGHGLLGRNRIYQKSCWSPSNTLRHFNMFWNLTLFDQLVMLFTFRAWNHLVEIFFLPFLFSSQCFNLC